MSPDSVIPGNAASLPGEILPAGLRSLPGHSRPSSIVGDVSWSGILVLRRIRKPLINLKK
jgi:hypothetical protein